MEFNGYLQSGSEGDDVKTLQEDLKALGFSAGRADGIFGDKTEAAVMAFQNSYGLNDDGVVGEMFVNTLNDALATDRVALSARTMMRGHRGDDVQILQEMLNTLGYDAGNPDGIFGGGTQRVVKAFQADQGLNDDGMVGPATVDALFRASNASDDGDDGGYS